MSAKTEIGNLRLYLFWSLFKIPRFFSITGNCKQKIWLKQRKAAPALSFSYFQHASKLVTHHKEPWLKSCGSFLLPKMKTMHYARFKKAGPMRRDQSRQKTIGGRKYVIETPWVKNFAQLARLPPAAKVPLQGQAAGSGLVVGTARNGGMPL